METKVTIRTRLLEARRALAPVDASSRSAAVRERLWAVPEFTNAHRVLTYVSAKDNEVDTTEIIRRLLAGGREVACPVVLPSGEMEWRRIARQDDLLPGRFGIPAPDAMRCPPVDSTRGAVVLVPGLAFARDGHRLGHGGGYFDRFLSRFDGTSIGLAYEFQVLDNLPIDPYDERVHWVVTEFGARNLHGRTIRERARMLIEIAHPAYQERLEREAREIGYLG